jgi:hypothetical protein
VVLIAIGIAACSPQGEETGESAVTKEPIQVVKRAHTDSLMRIPGVVGTAIGLCGDTPCIKVLVVRVTPELRKAIPQSLDGYRVELDETGEVKALDTARR